MTLVVIILARKGSKRCPKKNEMKYDERGTIVDIAVGKARMLAPKEIIISTDIQSVLDKYKPTLLDNAFAMRRAERLCGDGVTSESVVLEVLGYYALIQHLPESICLMQPTSPLLKPESLLDAYDQFKNYNLPALVSINKSNQPNGAFYFINSVVLREQKTFYPEGMGTYVLDEDESTDINYEFQYRIAQSISGGRRFAKAQGIG
jgi:CMP-N-acetylneuraminic acid synthetase